MSDYAQTFLEIVNHTLRKHADLAEPVEKIAAGVQGKAGGNLMLEWEKRRFSAPSPHFVKQAVVLRNGLDHCTWVETGTYMGDTTELLSKVARQVYSIEPEPKLFAAAVKRFEAAANVKIINGISEAVFPELLPTLNGDVCFWLDGHYSAGVTYQGPQDTPITDELASVAANLKNFSQAVVMVDDIRCFDPSNPEYANYPTLDFLVDWARATGLKWHIEQDIFVARTR
jgi:hypothetical protein